MYKRKTWREKMTNPDLPKIVTVPPNAPSRFGNGKILVPSPMEVDAYIRTIPEGQVSTMGQMRRFLAEKHSVNNTCPLTSGIFVRISAEAAEESARDGIREITPYWRIVKDDGALNPKLPGGVERQAERLRAEGRIIVLGKGKQLPRVVLDPKNPLPERIVKKRVKEERVLVRG